MADEGSYKIQVNTTVNGNFINLRGNSFEELVTLTEEAAKDLDRFLTAFTSVKEGIVAKDIFTGDAGPKNNGGGQRQGGGTQTKAKPKVELDSDGNPVCKHGKMTDMTYKNYKTMTHVCPERDRDKQCTPVDMR